jgi:two-component system OmpR family response regulator
MASLCLIVSGPETGADSAVLRAAFTAHGLPCEHVSDLRSACVVLSEQAVAAVVLFTRAGSEPLDAVRELQHVTAAPLLLLTPPLDEIDHILALELGASDVIETPASPRLVLARVRRLLRLPGADRAAAATVEPRELRLGALLIDRARGIARFDGRDLALTVAQFDTLALLAAVPATPVSRATLAGEVPGPAPAAGRRVDVTVSRLRRKLRDGGATAIRIEALYGRGYALTIQAPGPVTGMSPRKPVREAARGVGAAVG